MSLPRLTAAGLLAGAAGAAAWTALAPDDAAFSLLLVAIESKLLFWHASHRRAET